MQKKIILIFYLLSIPTSLLFAQNKTLLFQADFSGTLDTNLWKVELEAQPASAVYTENGQLIINSYGGATVWLNKPLSGNFEIIYKRCFILADGANDRLSDLNQFWMASDPLNTNLFTRTGKLEEYDALLLYYMGMGGNYNSTTRFRRYDGKGSRALIKEYLEKDYLLQPNHSYEIRTLVQNGTTKVWVDGVLFLNFADPHPLTEGYFGFRSTYSHQAISDLKVFQLL